MKPNAAAALACLTLAWPCAQAGRPLATDDAGTAPESTCQVEAWYVRQGTTTTAVLAPACGVAPGLELGLGLALPDQRQTQLTAGSLGFKWAPSNWTHETPWGGLALGLKGGAEMEQVAGTGWRHASNAGLLMLSLTPGDAWAVHLNLGRGQWRPLAGPRLQASLYSLAITWAPVEQALLFAEWQGNSRQADLAPAMGTVGGRWWLQKDKLGLDLTVGRPDQAGTRPQLSLGFGWYGIGY